MPGLQDPRRGILQTQINRCTSNVTPSPIISRYGRKQGNGGSPWLTGSVRRQILEPSRWRAFGGFFLLGRGCSSFASFFSKISDAFHVLFDPLANHIEGLFLRFGGHLREFSHVSQGLFETLFGEIRALLYGVLLASIGNDFLHRFLEDFCLPTNEALPALESDPIRFGESFDVLPFTVHKRREVDAWKSELAHEFGEVKNRRLGALFSRFDVVGHGGLFSRLAVVGHGALFSRFALIGDGALFRRFAVLGHDAFLGWSNVLAS